MSPVKEPNFFAFDGKIPKFRGPSETDLQGGFLCRNQLQNARYEFSVTKVRDYQRLFSWAKTEQTRGESSVSYMYAPEAPIRINDQLPDVRLIAILRHPADRAYSKFLQFQRDGLEPIADFAKALEAEDERFHEHWSPTWYYKRRGFYYEQLKRYYDIFDRNQIKVILYDEFRANPIEVLQDIFRFLEVKDSFFPDTRKQHNVSGGPVVRANNKLIDLMLNMSNQFGSSAYRHFAPHLFLKLQKINLAAILRKAKILQYKPIPQLIRRQLIDEYTTDILQLQELIDKDLSMWLQ